MDTAPAPSLKAFGPVLAPILAMTPDALYERQRVLTRDGLLIPAGGRYRGGGVRLGAENVAILVIAALATELLHETGERARAVAEAKTVTGRQCPFTGARNFKDALTKILACEELARDVSEISFSRSHGRAGILYTPVSPEGTDRTLFEARPNRKVEGPKFSVEVTMYSRELRQIADSLRKALAGKEE